MFIPDNVSATWLAAGSSPVDWCEENYTVSSHIAEFNNTISNILLVVLPLYLLASGAWNSFAKHISIAPHVLLILVALIGIGSACFHGYLSLFGQFLDEIAIVWLACHAYGFITPRKYLPTFLQDTHLKELSLVVSVLLSLLWFVHPLINPLVLMSLSFPCAYVIISEAFVHKHPETLYMARCWVLQFTIAIICWLVDMFFCGAVLGLGMPGLHFAWHVLSSIAVHHTISLFCFWKAQYDYPKVESSIQFYPDVWCGLPYVQCHAKLS